MRLIAKRPCSFGGRQFYIGDSIPEELVAEPSAQEKMGILSIVLDGEIQDGMLLEGEGFEGKVIVPIVAKEDGNTAEAMAVPLTEEEVQRVFTIMQMTADKASESIEDVNSEETLIVLHASDSRSGVKKAAKKRLEQLSYTKSDQNESIGGNETTEDNTESGT